MRIVLVFRALVLAVLAGGCVGNLVYPSAEYRGRVVDAETGQPLAGAVVLAVWYREVPVAPQGLAIDYHDSLEVLADAEGRFTIPARRHVTVLGHIREPDLVVYSPGYAPYPSVLARPEGDAITTAYETRYFDVALTRANTRQQRLKFAHLPFDVRVPLSRAAEMIRRVNEERKDLAMPPIGEPGDRK